MVGSLLAVEEHTSLASKDSCRVMVSQKFTLLEQGVQLSQPQLQAESGSEEQSQPVGVFGGRRYGFAGRCGRCPLRERRTVCWDKVPCPR